MPYSSHDRILAQLRDLICEGKLKRGSKIPTRSEMAQYFSVSQSTIQKAVAALEKDGFIESQGKRGSFIATAPPHIYRYGAIFPYQREDPLWSPFHECSLQILEGLQQQGSSTQTYHGPPQDIQSSVLDDLKSRRLAGVLCFGEHEQYRDLVMAIPQGLIATFHPISCHERHLPIHLNQKELLQMTLAWMTQQQLSCPAIIASNHSRHFNLEQFAHLCQKAQVQFSTRHVFELHPGNQHRTVVNIIRLLSRIDDAPRPDLIYLADDELLPTEEVLADLLEDTHLKMLSISHFPLSGSAKVSSIPRIGVDLNDVIIQVLDEIRNFQMARPRQGFVESKPSFLAPGHAQPLQDKLS